MATLETIAKHVGVSKSTVSRVLNNDQSLNIKPETRAVIFHAADKLNYSTKKYTKKMKEILVVLNLSTIQVDYNDPFFTSIRLHIEKESSSRSIKTSFLNLDNVDTAFTDNLFKSIDGIVIVGSLQLEFVNKLQKICPNIVSISFEYEQLNIPSILTDEYRTPKNLLKILYDEGHRKIIHIGPESSARTQAYTDFCYEHSLTPTIYESNFSLESGFEAMQQAIDEGLDASCVICASDTIAFGAMKSLHKANISIPNDIQITGFNDIPLSSYTHPSLTTIHVHDKLMVELAINTLIENLNAKEILAVRQFVPTELVLRDSTTLS